MESGQDGLQGSLVPALFIFKRVVPSCFETQEKK